MSFNMEFDGLAVVADDRDTIGGDGWEIETASDSMGEDEAYGVRGILLESGTNIAVGGWAHIEGGFADPEKRLEKEEEEGTDDGTDSPVREGKEGSAVGLPDSVDANSVLMSVLLPETVSLFPSVH